MLDGAPFLFDKTMDMKKIFVIALMALMTISCTDNPLLKEWKDYAGVPPFDRITPEHYMPAVQKAIEIHNAEIEKIVSNRAEADFENTMEAYDRSGLLLNRILLAFENEESIASTDEIRKISEEMSPLVSRHFSEIELNEKLFGRIKAVYDKKDSLGLEPDQMRLLEETYKSFVRRGACLDAEKKEQLKDVDEKIASLQLKFSQNLLNETGSWTLTIDNEEDLAGLSADFIADAAARAEAAGQPGKWVVGLDNPSVMPFLQSADNRALRIKVLDAYANRCNNNNACDNKDIVKEIIALKMQKAAILGYETYADYMLEQKMAKTPEAVYSLLNAVWQPALRVAGAELDDIKAVAAEDRIENIHPADWRYYFEKSKAAKYSVSEDGIKEYFQYENVRDGIFYVANRLFGISFNRVDGIPVPHPDAEAFECIDTDGSSRGILYMDMFARPGEKSGGAWCSEYCDGGYDAKGVKRPAVITIVGNFARPSENKPSLLTPDDTETFFHEFGHAMAALLSDVRYHGNNGFVRDFVELPSQLNEHWAFEPEVLAQYAKHYRTGEIIPMEIVEKLQASNNYGQGFAMTELVAAMLLDMDLYSMKELPEPLDVLTFEAKTMAERGLIQEILPRYRVPYFLHIFSHGYDVGYYSYMWANVLDCDAYEAFKETGDIFNQEVAAAYRREILSRCNEEDAMDLYVKFRGHEPSIEPLLKDKGLN